MASDLDFVEFITDQISDECHISFRKMFGEYAIYSKGKIVALVCDNKLFIKSTKSGKEFIGKIIEKAPYPGAKNALLIQDQIEDKEWLSKLILITEKELPEQKKKRKPKKKRNASKK